ncbi:MAG: N-acetylneuraminate synthase family protein [DPANN group archaeon]|nr:N-acetylneuraminate synthase family protein [DPANN group archaeon]
MNLGLCDTDKEVFVISETGPGHDGNFLRAKQMIQDAAETGAHAVKFQTYKGEKLITNEVLPLPHMRQLYKTQRERFKGLEFSEEQWLELADYAKAHGIIFMSSCWDEDSLEMLDKHIVVHKIGSGDFTNIPLIRKVIAKGKPVIMSTAMASFEEIKKVVAEFKDKNQLALLHCVAGYPGTPDNQNNLLSIPFLKKHFGVTIGLSDQAVTVGYSDHTPGSLASLAAVAMGARIIEKHFTYNHRLKHGDHPHSLDKQGFIDLIADIKRINEMLGEEKKDIMPIEKETNKVGFLRRSLFAARDLKAGTIITEKDLVALRPGDKEIGPLEWDKVVGKRLKRDYKLEEPLSWKDLE